MRRSLVDIIKGLFHTNVRGVEPVQSRIENARMSCTRLKALKPIDLEKDQATAQAETPIKFNTPKTITTKITTLANMSHYRLEAYVATLPAEQRKNAEQSLV